MISRHLRVSLFFCRPCNKTWTTVTKSDIVKHVKAVHDGDESVIEDYRTQYANEIRQITDKCFPPRHRGPFYHFLCVYLNQSVFNEFYQWIFVCFRDRF